MIWVSILLFSANIPISSQRRIEQSARLAKRVLSLEKINQDLIRENEQEGNSKNEKKILFEKKRSLLAFIVELK